MINYTPDSSYSIATPQIGVDIYSQSGSKLNFSGGPGSDNSNTGIISATVNKNIKDVRGGTFIIEIPPGGPNGVNDPNTWTNQININSFAVIYMRRGSSRRIVMLGIVTKIYEKQVWTNNKVDRLITIEGMDFTYYFSIFSYYTLSFLGLLENSTLLSVAGFIAGLLGKTVEGPPSFEGDFWLNNVMLGTGSTAPNTTAVLDYTYITYKGNRIFLRDIFGEWIEPFKEAGAVAYIPFMQDLIQNESGWMDKFLDMFPWPYYEFFIMTANEEMYPDILDAQVSNNEIFGYGHTSNNSISIPGYDPVYPIVVARVNPLPWVSMGPSSSNAGELNQDRWANLPTFNLGNYGFISSNVEYNIDKLANFFSISTTDTRAVSRNAGSSTSNLPSYQFIGVILDQYSIRSFGYRPQSVDIKWLTFLSPDLAKATPENEAKLFPILLGKFASYYIPSPMMLEGEITIPMWLDVYPGCRFIYSPFKNGIPYMFYIEGFSHCYEFGGRSYTKLSLSRGLKVSEYNNSDILTQLHMDQVVRLDGVLTTRTDLAASPGAAYYNPAITNNLGLMADVYRLFGF